MTPLRPTVFISYAHANSAHKKWVKKLSDALRQKSIQTILDQNDLRLGQLIDEFQQDGIGRADRVLVVCSDAYVEKANNDPKSGVGQERQLMTLELAHNNGSMKFIPVVRENATKALPRCLGNRLWIDFSKDAAFAEALEVLSKEIRRDKRVRLTRRSRRRPKAGRA